MEIKNFFKINMLKICRAGTIVLVFFYMYISFNIEKKNYAVMTDKWLNYYILLEINILHSSVKISCTECAIC